jgi:hypothetical protein
MGRGGRAPAPPSWPAAFARAVSNGKCETRVRPGEQCTGGPDLQDEQGALGRESGGRVYRHVAMMSEQGGRCVWGLGLCAADLCCGCAAGAGWVSEQAWVSSSRQESRLRLVLIAYTTIIQLLRLRSKGVLVPGEGWGQHRLNTTPAVAARTRDHVRLPDSGRCCRILRDRTR